MNTKVKCLQCQKEFEKRNSEIKRSKNHFCSKSCAATYNNIKFERHKSLHKNFTPRKQLYCTICGQELLNKNWKGRRFCSGNCAQTDRYNQYIERWLIGKETGNRGKGKTLSISKYARRWLFEQNKNRCQICGWQEIHPTTGLIPLHVNHIDGNALNTVPANLELLCPNHHSLTETYGALNRGNGKRK